MGYKTYTTEVDVDVDLADFDTDELIEELESRGHFDDYNSIRLVDAIYQKRRLGKDYQPELDKLIFAVLGKIV